MRAKYAAPLTILALALGYTAARLFADATPAEAAEYFAIIRLVLAIASATACWVFVLIYHITTGGDWKRSEHGVHLMVFTASLGVIITYVVATIVGWVPREYWPYASTVIYLIILALVVWRIVLLLRAQRRS